MTFSRTILQTLIILASSLPSLRSQERELTWTGTWRTQWRTGGAVLQLLQEGERVTGSYLLYNGQVEGIARGKVLDGRWTEASGRSGAFLFTLSPDGRDFMGRFDSGEWWTGTRLSNSHETEAAPSDWSSPRETLRSFITATNASHGGLIEHLQPGLESIDFSAPEWRSERSTDGSLLPQDRIDYTFKLAQVLDELTFRIWSIPGSVEAGDRPHISAPLEQAGTSEKFELGFVRQGALWKIDPPTPEALNTTLERLYKRRGGKAPPGGEHLELRNPRATMRTFLESMTRLDSGGQKLLEHTMDLKSLGGAMGKDEVRLMAYYLKHIIDRIGSVIYQEIPDDSQQQDPYFHFRHRAGNIVIAPFPTDDGTSEWRFTADTLNDLRRLYAAIEEMPEIVGAVKVEHPSVFFAVRNQLRSHAPWMLKPVGPIEVWQWLAIALFFVTSTLLALVLTSLILLTLRRRGLWAATLATQNMRRALVWPLRITFIGVLWYFKVGALGLPEAISGPVRGVAATLAIGSGVWLGYRGLGLLGSFSNRTIGKTGQRAIFTSLSLGLLRIALVIVGALLLAEAWDLPYSSVLAGLSVGGLALALAAKQTVENMIAGFTLFADSPLSVGDFCRYGNKLGSVEEIGLRSTRIRTRERTVVSIPNSEFANLQLENFAKRDRILMQTTISLSYETTTDQLRFVLVEFRRLLIGHPLVDPDPARVRLIAFGAYSVDLELYAYVSTSDWDTFLGIREDIYLRIMEIVDQSGTGFAFPSQINYLARHKGNDESLTRNAEEAVEHWRAENKLPFPGFSPEEIAQMKGKLDYPPPGTPLQEPT